MLSLIRRATLCVALILLAGCATKEPFELRKGLANFNLGVDHAVDHTMEGTVCSVTSSLSPGHPPTVVPTGVRKSIKHGLLPADGTGARMMAKCCPLNDDLWVFTWDVTIGRPGGEYHSIGDRDQRRFEGRSPDTCKAVRGGRI